jgi:hypothetical protein
MTEDQTADLRAQMDRAIRRLDRYDARNARWTDLVARADALADECSHPPLTDLHAGAAKVREAVYDGRRREFTRDPVSSGGHADLVAQIAAQARLVDEWLSNGWRSSGGTWIEVNDTKVQQTKAMQRVAQAVSDARQAGVGVRLNVQRGRT